MKKLIFEVQEFDSIIEESKHWAGDNCKPMPKKYFNEFARFIETCAANNEQQNLLNFCSIVYKKGKGRVIRVKNYVGLIQLESGYQVQIMPKIYFGHKKNLADPGLETKRIFWKMVQSLKDPKFSVFNKANVDISKLDIMEIFIAYYVKLVQEAVKQDLKRAYITTEDNLNAFKGKLLTAQNIRNNLVHKERFYMQFDEYSVNRPINRIIKATLLKLLRLTDNLDINKNIRQLLGVFDEVAPSNNYAKDFAAMVLDRSTKDYQVIMKWSEMFLNNKSVTNFAGDDKSLALLFPMHQLYEDYVALKFKQHFSKCGWVVHSQHRGLHVFDEPNRFSLRPDILMSSLNTSSPNTIVWTRNGKY